MAESNHPQKRERAPRAPKGGAPKAGRRQKVAAPPREWPASNPETWPLARLIPYAKNARVHTPDQVDQIAASMRQFGWTIPVLVDPAGEIIAGHGRVLAAQQLGVQEVPVVIATGWSEADRRAYRLADNQLTVNSSWDAGLLSQELHFLNGVSYDLGLTGFGEDELTDLMAPIGEGAGTGGGGDGTSGEGGGGADFNYSEQFGVIVLCRDEAEQQEVYSQLQEQGFNLKVVVT